MSEEDNFYQQAIDRAEVNAEVAEEYGAPDQPEKLNQFSILKSAFDSKDNLKTTFLRREELGKPLFSVRFYQDCATLCELYGAELVKTYFKNKVQNIAASGMSNEGFAMKLSVTNKRDVTRRHVSKFSVPEEVEKEGP